MPLLDLRTDSMPDIFQLPQSVVNKIAAGEVIERPASVVKELLENAVDAGATRIEVSVAGGGSELIRVSDDGCGIAAEQLPLAVAAHATSKIRSADDLFRVGTLGFRGEALASIGEVSRLVIRSRPPESSAGAELELTGGRLAPIAPCGCSPGTQIEVHNLFYNTPVRRKFLRTATTEMGHIGEAFTRLALAHPQVHFVLRNGAKPLHDLAPSQHWPARIAAFFGQELADGLIWVESHDGPVKLSGYVAHPTHSRGHNKMQYLFLNGRAIRDRSLQHALSEAYRGLLLTGRFPICFLHIAMPPESVDVNVHPTKLEVRFQDAGNLYGQLLGTLRTKFLTSDLTSRLQPTTPDSDIAHAHDGDQADRLRRELVDWAKGKLAAQDAQQSAAVGLVEPSTQSQFSFPQTNVPRKPLELVTLNRSNWATTPEIDEDADPWPAIPDEPSDDADSTASGAHGGQGREPSMPGHAMGGQMRPASAMQIHNRYVIAESAEGMLVIDQHALHERIIYEQLRERVLAGALETQRLLVPEPVDLGPAEAAAAVAHQDLLAQLGVSIEPFGGDTILVTSYPAMLANMRPSEVLHDIVTSLLAEGKTPERRDLIDELLHMISCKAAIKAGDRLSGDEIAALVEQRHLAQDTHHCPHGRPTVLVFTREQLDKQFMRT